MLVKSLAALTRCVIPSQSNPILPHKIENENKQRRVVCIILNSKTLFNHPYIYICPIFWLLNMMSLKLIPFLSSGLYLSIWIHFLHFLNMLVHFYHALCTICCNLWNEWKQIHCIILKWVSDATLRCNARMHNVL